MKKCKYCGLEIELMEGEVYWSLTDAAHSTKPGLYYYTCHLNYNDPRTHEPLTEADIVAQILSKYED